MSRLAVLLCVTVVAGCAQPSAEPTCQKPSPTENGEEIDFAGWSIVGGLPYPVSLEAPRLCDINPPGIVGYEPKSVGQKRRGPHDQPAIVVRVNAVGFDTFRARESPLPVGTVIVKEKHDTTDAKGLPKEYGAMIKREPGYDPTRGDWEYVYVVRGPEKKVTRGHLDSCIYCHVRQMEQDYVFRTYMKP